jgi:hypothetical protein
MAEVATSVPVNLIFYRGKATRLSDGDRGQKMHFELYLKNKGVISAEQLTAALEEQLDKLVPIGQLALEENVLSARDIFTILQAQNDSPGQRFGDLAVEMGLMTRETLVRLLTLQADRKRPIVDILVGQRALTHEQAATELAEYRRSHSRTERRTPATLVATLPARLKQPTYMTSNDLVTV